MQDMRKIIDEIIAIMRQLQLIMDLQKPLSTIIVFQWLYV